MGISGPTAVFFSSGRVLPRRRRPSRGSKSGFFPFPPGSLPSLFFPSHDRHKTRGPSFLRAEWGKPTNFSQGDDEPSRASPLRPLRAEDFVGVPPLGPFLFFSPFSRSTLSTQTKTFFLFPSVMEIQNQSLISSPLLIFDAYMAETELWVPFLFPSGRLRNEGCREPPISPSPPLPPGCITSRRPFPPFFPSLGGGLEICWRPMSFLPFSFSAR